MRYSDKFEAWMESEGWKLPLARNGYGGYVNGQVQARWKAWQAALAAHPKRTTKPGQADTGEKR